MLRFLRDQFRDHCIAEGEDWSGAIDSGFSGALRAVVVTQPQLIRTSAYGAVVPDLLSARGPKRIEILLAAGAKIPEQVIKRAIELKNREVLLALAPHDEKAQMGLSSATATSSCEADVTLD